MNKALISILILLSASSASYFYAVDIDRSGSASVTISLEGGDAVVVALPQDASSIRMVGGSYSLEGGNATINAGPSGLATFSFSTSMFTAKTGSGWKLAFSAPEGSDVRVYLPPFSSLEGASPQPESISSDESRMALDLDAGPATVYYSLGQAPAPVEQPDYITYAILLFSLLVIGIVAWRKGGIPAAIKPSAPDAAPAPRPAPADPPRPPSLEMTGGKLGMMETFNENDLVIVNHLLACGGKSRRNDLERKTGISKSSLAMALNRLEKRKIIELDRTSTTHFVKLSDYFLRL
ncbi:MAG: hypothetical protein V1827_03305 [Candidatus Micrarchaeota archaeon]